MHIGVLAWKFALLFMFTADTGRKSQDPCDGCSALDRGGYARIGLGECKREFDSHLGQLLKAGEETHLVQ